MKLRVFDQRMRPSALYKLVAVGYALGVIVIFLPFFVLFAAAGLFGAPAFDGKLSPVIMILLLPVIATMQGLIFALVILGFWIYSRFRKIEVTEERHG
jgi:hypothetical protein